MIYNGWFKHWHNTTFVLRANKRANCTVKVGLMEMNKFLDIYSEEGVEEKFDEELISSTEEAFMLGYLAA